MPVITEFPQGRPGPWRRRRVRGKAAAGSANAARRRRPAPQCPARRRPGSGRGDSGHPVERPERLVPSRAIRASCSCSRAWPRPVPTSRPSVTSTI